MTTVTIERLGLVFASVLALAACGGEGPAGSATGPSGVRAAQSLTVAPAASVRRLPVGLRTIVAEHSAVGWPAISQQ